MTHSTGVLGGRALFHRIIRSAALLLAILLLAPASQAFAQQRIVAVGDLHGDYDAWIAIARAAGLIDAQNRWSGGNATLVQLGDITDRGPDSLKIIRNLQQLAARSAARAAAGSSPCSAITRR